MNKVNKSTQPILNNPEQIKIMVIFNSSEKKSTEEYSRAKSKLINYLKNDNFRIYTHTKLMLELDKVIYLFFDINERNINSFQEKHPEIHQVYSYATNIKSDIVNKIESMLPENGKIDYYPDEYGKVLFEEYRRTFDKIIIYKLEPESTPTKVIKDEILSYKFKEGKHYNTKKEANEQLMKVCEKRIQGYQQQIVSLNKYIERDLKIIGVKES